MVVGPVLFFYVAERHESILGLYVNLVWNKLKSFKTIAYLNESQSVIIGALLAKYSVVYRKKTLVPERYIVEHRF